MSQFYTGLAAMANRLLKSRGQVVQLTRAASRTYDVATSSASGGDATETGQGVVLNYSDFTRSSGNRSIQGVAETSGRIKLLMGTSGITKAPSVGDTVTYLDETGASRTASVLSCDTLNPAGTVVAYFCQLGQ